MATQKETTIALSLDRRETSLTDSEIIALDKYIDGVLAEYNSDSDEIAELAMESASCVSGAQSLSDILSSQGALGRVWGGITGKNAKIRSKITNDLADAQYASMCTLGKLAAQNSRTMGVVVELNKRSNQLILKVNNNLIKTNSRINELTEKLNTAIDNIHDEIEEVQEETLTRCPSCRQIIGFNSFICEHCGNINEKAIARAKLQPGNREYLIDISRDLRRAIEANKNLKPKILWNEQATEYADKMQRIKNLMDTDIIKKQLSGQKEREEKMTGFIEACEEQAFQVAIVGTVKAGKSTLINALLGDELASMDITPETSVLSKFRNSKEKDYIRVKFYTKAEWAQLTRSAEGVENGFMKQMEKAGVSAESELIGRRGKRYTYFEFDDREALKKGLERWTDSESPEHFYVSEVEIGIKDSVLPDGVVLVDTPGLNDPVAYRSEVTRKYINKAHAVIACLNAKNIETSDIRFLGRIKANLKADDLENLFIVATQTDTLNAPLEDWPKQKEHYIETLSGLYENKKTLQNRLFGTSAYVQNCINAVKRDGNFDISQNFALRIALMKYRIQENMFNEKIAEIESYTGINTLLRELNSFLTRNYRAILINALRMKYNSIIADIKSEVEKIDKESKVVANTNVNDIKQIKKEIEDKKSEIKELIEDKEQLEHDLGELEQNIDELGKYISKRLGKISRAQKSKNRNKSGLMGRSDLWRRLMQNNDLFKDED